MTDTQGYERFFAELKRRRVFHVSQDDLVVRHSLSLAGARLGYCIGTISWSWSNGFNPDTRLGE